MARPSSTEPVAYLIDPDAAPAIDLFGPTLQFVTPEAEDDAAPSVMRGAVPAGGIVPLHSHGDPETFIGTSGELLGLAYAGEGDFTWVPIRAGVIFHIPGGAKHAFRNRSREPAVLTIVSTARMARFFREVGSPAIGTPATAEALEHFAVTSERYGYWNASPEENLEIGLHVPDIA